MTKLTEFDKLKLRISLIISKGELTFINSIDEFSSLLYIKFKKDYLSKDIERAILQLEESVFPKEETIIDIPEDFKLE